MADRDVYKASLYASDDVIAQAWKEWARRRQCIHCGKIYTLFSSFGMRECKQHHKPKETFREDDGRIGEKFICCNKPIPRPYFHRGGSLVPSAILLDQFPSSQYNICQQVTPLPPQGCVKADHSDGSDAWPIGLVDNLNDIIPTLRPVGGWKIGEQVKIGENVYEIRSPPNPFGEVRVEWRLISGERKTEAGGGDTERKEAHLKDMRPIDGWDPDDYDTLEIMDLETGKQKDRITKFGTYWREWSAGVSISDIAGVLPYMVNPAGNEDVCGNVPFANRPGMVDVSVPVVWRINVPLDSTNNA